MIAHGPLDPAEGSSLSTLKTLYGVCDTLTSLRLRFSVRTTASEPSINDTRLASLQGAVFIEQCHGHRSLLVELEKAGIPVVIAKMERDEHDCATRVDRIAASQLAVNAASNLGHSRIAYVGPKSSTGFYRDAQEGYLAGLERAGIALNDCMISDCSQATARAGYVAAWQLLKNASSRPTAIVAARDIIANGVCGAIKDAGLVVGLNVSVIGFDNTSWPQGSQFLTTFQEPCHEMGVAAAEILVQRMANRQLPRTIKQFETPLLLRRSAGPCVGSKTSYFR